MTAPPAFLRPGWVSLSLSLSASTWGLGLDWGGVGVSCSSRSSSPTVSARLQAAFLAYPAAPAWPQLMPRSRPSACNVQMAVLPGPPGASAPWAGPWPRERWPQVWLFLQRALCTVPGLGGGGWLDFLGWPQPLRTSRDRQCHPGLCLCQGLLLAGETGSLLSLGGLDWEALLTAACAGLPPTHTPSPPQAGAALLQRQHAVLPGAEPVLGPAAPVPGVPQRHPAA